MLRRCLQTVNKLLGVDNPSAVMFHGPMSTIPSPSPEALLRIAGRRAASLADLAHAGIERMILEGELAPGERLNELALAGHLGVSRGPLREALRGLEREGLVQSGPARRGMSVRRLDAAEVAELYDTRALLQGFCCALLARRATPPQMAALRAQVAAMAAALSAGDAARYYALNLAFHDAMLEAAAHRRTAALYRAMLKESHPVRRQMLDAAENRAASNAEHAAMLDAIAAGEPEAARRAGEAHVLAGKRRWLAALGGG